MKKDDLLKGATFLFIGILSFTLAVLLNNKMSGIFYGIAGIGIGFGLMMYYRYFYWKKPENHRQLEGKLENEYIERHDELKLKLLDRAGRITFLFGIGTISFALLIFSILGSLEIIDNLRIVILFLAGYLVYQILFFVSVFNLLLKKY